MPDPWSFLTAHTTARIAQGRAGHSLPTDALLQFQLDHARARDAVHADLDIARLLTELNSLLPQPILVQSDADNRQTYLQRPDFGRRLNDESRQRIQGKVAELQIINPNFLGFTLAIVIADGLSATAVNRHALPVASALVTGATALGWSLAPLVLVRQGRVAIADEIAHALRAELLLILIGERPGLTSPDSLGGYLTFAPRPGLTDAARNCVSNIRPEGLGYEFAVQKLLYLLSEMKNRRISGVGLKDEMETLPGYSANSALNDR